MHSNLKISRPLKFNRCVGISLGNNTLCMSDGATHSAVATSRVRKKLGLNWTNGQIKYSWWWFEHVKLKMHRRQKLLRGNLNFGGKCSLPTGRVLVTFPCLTEITRDSRGAMHENLHTSQQAFDELVAIIKSHPFLSFLPS